MNQHVLECICTHRTAPLQLRFARQALRFVTRRPDYSVKASRRGLIVSGETEASIESVLKVLRIVYDADLCAGQFTILYRHGPVVEEPHMGVRVLCPASCFASVKVDLLSRAAQILDAELRLQIGVVRATASLAMLLGYSRQLAALTDERAHEVLWLSHYAPLKDAALAEQQQQRAEYLPMHRGLLASQE